MFRCGCKIRFLFIGILLFLYFPLSIHAATSLNDYPQIKSHWDDGELGMAISKLKDVAKDKPKNEEILELLKKVTFQKSKLDEWINKGTSLLKQEKFEDAQSILDFAKAISPNYKPYVTLMNRIKITEEELKYPGSVIFDGKPLNDNWKVYEAHGGNFIKHTQFKNNELMVNVPKGNGWGKVGIASTKAVIDFTETNQSLSYRLKFNFETKNTTGFVINLKDIDSWRSIGVVYRHLDDNKSAILELWRDGKLNGKLKIDNMAPEYLRLVIDPNNRMYLYLPDGTYLQTTSLKYPLPKKGYKLEIYSQAEQKNLPVKMALKLVKLKKVPFSETRLSNINKNETIVFDGKYLYTDWQPYEAHGGNFIKHTQFKNNELMVNVPKGNGWGKVGIASTKAVIDFTETNQSLSYRLKFNFETKNTTGFVINLKDIDSWHSLSIVYKHLDDNKSAMLELWRDGKLNMQLAMNRTVPEFLDLVIQPNNFIYVELPNGRYLQTTSLKYELPKKGYNLEIYSQTVKKGLPVKMTLKSITLKKLPFKKSFDPSNLGTQEGKIVLFDGKHFEDRWIAHNEQYMDYFREYAMFDDNKLIIDIPKDNKWGEAGILSPEPLVWLDRLGKDGEIKTTFSFDPLETTGFTIAAGDINSFWKQPTGSNFNLSWAKVEDKNISKLRFKIRNKLLLDENLTGQAPSILTLSFKNGEIGIEGDTFSKKTFEWPQLAENRALHLWAFSHAYKKNIPVKMALKKIELDRKFGEPLPPSKPAKGVSLLSEKEIYGSETLDRWICYEETVKGKESNCTLGSSHLVITIPKEAKSTFGMKSKEKIISLDTRRIRETPLKIIMYFNPKKTNSFDITLGKYHVFLEKKSSDSYAFKWGKTWSRNIDAKWLENDWNGKVNITMAKDGTNIELEGSVAIHTSNKMSGKFPLYVLAAPLNTPMKDGANLELKKITTQWLVPEGMTAVDRWELIDNEDFDPDAFLRELREGK